MNAKGFADWVAVDWGTTHLRAWAMAHDGTVQAQAGSQDGMGRLARHEFEPALLALIDDWIGPRPTPVVACGMVGARQGWVEAPYTPVPVAPHTLRPVPVPHVGDPRVRLWIVPGLSQTKPPDVMRGEETQITGFLVAQPTFDGVLCLPGTHTKWVRISAAEVVNFQTYMTGEVFDLLAHQSVLRHDVAKEGAMDHLVFQAAVDDALSRPERMAQRLFALRAGAILDGTTPAATRARLSGTLIGAELSAARPYWLGQDVVVAGAQGLAHLYAHALRGQGAQTQTIADDVLTQTGLTHFYTSQIQGVF